MLVKPIAETNFIITGHANTRPVSFLLCSVYNLYFLTLLNNSNATHCQSAPCKGAILLLVKPVFYVLNKIYGLQLQQQAENEKNVAWVINKAKITRTYMLPIS